MHVDGQVITNADGKSSQRTCKVTSIYPEVMTSAVLHSGFFKKLFLKHLSVFTLYCLKLGISDSLVLFSAGQNVPR